MKALAYLLLLPLGITLTSSAPANTPNQAKEVDAAMRYIHQMAEGTIDLTQDTAISSYSGIQRQKTIREQLDFLRKTRFSEGDIFTFEAQKNQGDFAAVLLRSENSRTPLSIRIHTLALIQKKGTWLAAPLPGSFANTGYGYDESVEKSVKSLERWMAREKATRESQARQKAADHFLAAILKEEKMARPESLTKKQAALNFITQCRQKNLLGVLASMGAASDELKDSLETTANLISQGLNTKDPANDWFLVTHPSVTMEMMNTAEKSEEIAIGFWNPIAQQHSHILYFPTRKSHGKRFVTFPHLLKIAMLPEHERWQQRWQQHHNDEQELKDKLPATILKNHPPIPFGDDDQKLIDHFLKSLSQLNFTDCIALLPRKGDYFSKKENQLQTLTEFSQLWSNLYRNRTSPHNALPLIKGEKISLLPLQYANTNRPGEFHLIKIWLLKESDGWHLIPEKTLTKFADQPLKDRIKLLDKKMRSTAKERKEEYSRALMAKVSHLSPPLTLAPVENDVAEKTLTQFRLFLRAKDTASALSLCAVLEGTSHAQTLRTFNYALRGASDHSDNDLVLGISRSDHWLGISLRTESKTSREYDYPLYLVINTKTGPKILLDVDLRYATNKGRKLLNSRNWSKLENTLPKESHTHIQTLFKNHAKRAAADIKPQP